MPPTLHSHDRGDGTAPVISLPTELWQEIANRFSTEEWVRTCGSLCRTFYDLQPRKIKVTVNPGDKGQEKLRWTARHWKQAVILKLHFGYVQETDGNLFGDLSQTLGEAKEAAAAKSVTVSVTPHSPMREDSKHLAAYLEKSLGSYWKNIKYLEMDVQHMFTIPPLHKLRMLRISMTTFDHFQGLLASICSLAKLEQLHLKCIAGSFEPESFNVGCLSCLDTLVLDQIVPKAAEFPSVLKSLKLTGNAATIEGVSWLNPQVPLKALDLTSDLPLSDEMRSMLHDIRHSPVESFHLESTCDSRTAPAQHFSMGCSLAGATLLPYFQALKSINISTWGNVSIVVPAVSALEWLFLMADIVDISIENLSSFAARMHRVAFCFNHAKGEGFKKLQTLRTSRDFQVTELAFGNGSGATPRRLFSAGRSIEEQLARILSGG